MWKLEDRGPMMIEPGWKVYRGMIVGEHTRDNDLEINVLKGKQLTNIRTTSKDEAVRLTPPIRMSLEKALAYIEDDELVEVTPKSIRLRKKLLDPNDRKRADAARHSDQPVRRAVLPGDIVGAAAEPRRKRHHAGKRPQRVRRKRQHAPAAGRMAERHRSGLSNKRLPAHEIDCRRDARRR